ncbi:MAG: HD domain-containing protein [Bacilli bacterium]|nr:HD domain-containing protein [Bacilli bacterium]
MLVEKYNNLNKQNSNSILDKYFETKTLQRLKGKGLFCGMDYVGIDSLKPREYYSRYDHSKNVAYTAWKLSEDLKVALAGAFHDVGSLSFAHVNSFKKGDSLKQESDELSVKEVLLRDKELLEYLYQDGISLDDVIDGARYPLIDKKIPALCLDRVDGILATCLFWAKTHSFEQIEGFYNMLTYFETLNGMTFDMTNERLLNFNGEIVISEYDDVWYEDFFDAIGVYSKLLLTKEDRYLMEILGLTLKYYEDIGIISERDLFEMSEQEIISKILDSKYGDILKDVLSLDKVEYAKDNDSGLILISKPKIRQANPLCWGHMRVCDIYEITGEFFRELVDLSEDIKLTDRPIVGNLSKETMKVLSRYRRK